MDSTIKKRIYLVGFMGVGKSTIGKLLADQMGYKFLDIDRVFEKKYKISISGFFDKYNEELFRKLENEVLLDTFKLDNVVVSTGGGTAYFYDSIKAMNKNGFTVYLEMTQEALFHRLKRAKRKRPLVEDKSDTELKNIIANKMNERLPFYEQANLIFNAINIDISDLKNAIDNY